MPNPKTEISHLVYLGGSSELQIDRFKYGKNGVITVVKMMDKLYWHDW